MPQVLTKPVAPISAPKTAVDYQADALAALTGADKGKQSQTTTDTAEPSALEAKVKEDGGNSEVPPLEKDPSAISEKPAAKEEIPPSIRQAFDKLASEKAALRKDRDAMNLQVKEATERASKAEALTAAKSPLELLRAAGFSWKDAVEEMTGMRPEGEEPDAKPAAKAKADKKLTLEDLDPEAAADLKAWKADRAAAQAKAGREKITGHMKEYAEKEGDKYSLVVKLGEYDKVVEFIERHFEKYKELPGATPQESMEIAMAHVEEDLQNQAKRFGFLTRAPEGDMEEPAAENRESAVTTQAASDQARSKTLSNSQAGASRTGSPKEPQTPEEYRAAALAVMLKAEKR